MAFKYFIEVISTRGSNSQQCRTGVYRIYPETFNQKPTFKHESKQEYLYYMNKGKGFWMVKTTIECFEIQAKKFKKDILNDLMKLQLSFVSLDQMLG